MRGPKSVRPRKDETFEKFTEGGIPETEGSKNVPIKEVC